MSRTLVIRRLTAVFVLLAILGFALPAAAATPRHPAKPTATAPTLLDTVLSWIVNLLGGSSQAGAEGRAKAASSPTVSTTSGISGPSTDVSIGVDPNGHS